MSDAANERARMLRENQRRAREVPAERYAAWNRTEQHFRNTRRRAALDLLERRRALPSAASRCLDLGFGGGVWLIELLGLGVREPRLAGVELDLRRAAAVKARLPATPILVGDGSTLPLATGSFDLVVLSTVLSSILDPPTQERCAREAVRVLAPAGALLWYDFRVDNPANPNVRGVSRQRLAALFPDLEGEVRSLTLAPPIARRVARFPALAECLEALPFLRSHLVAVLGRRRIPGSRRRDTEIAGER